MRIWICVAGLLMLCGFVFVSCSNVNEKTLAPSAAFSASPQISNFGKGEELWIVGRAPASTSAIEDRDRWANVPDPGRHETFIDLPTGDLPHGSELHGRTESSPKLIPLPLKHTDVKAEIVLHVGSVSVQQQYHNPYSEKIEAVYVFPLPENAAVREFVMMIGERRIRGIIREREEARRFYLEARRAGHVASLMTEERPNIFTQSVANIEPGKSIDIDITYFHTLRCTDGEYEFVFPMTVGPRYNPPGSTDGVGAVPAGARGSSGQTTEVEYLRPDEISTRDVALTVAIDAGMTIEGLESPTHAIDVTRPSETTARVSLRSGDRIPNKDFVLRYKVAGSRLQGALAAFRDESTGYFVLVLEPPASVDDIPPAPREMVFVLDCSGSMDGSPIAKAKAALKGCLRRLASGDTFRIIRFSDRASALGSDPIPATSDNVERGIQFVDSLQSEGGTNMLDGIRAALGSPADESRLRIVAFMTDGFIGNDAQVLAEVESRVGNARIFSMGVGSSVNRHLLEGISRLGRGAVAYLALEEPDTRLVDDFYRQVERAALRDIQIDWGEMRATEVYPRKIPDLFAGRPVTLTGKFAAGATKADVRVTGILGNSEHELRLALDPGSPGLRHKALASVWARAKIGDLADQALLSASARDVAAEIRDVALQHGLLSDFTAFVAVDSLLKTVGDHGTSITVPAFVPAGVRYETTVGEN